MVTVTLLAVIILGLVAAFNTTQKAMVTGLAQADTLQDGRAATDMMAREIEQAVPAPFSAFGHVLVQTNTTNLWSGPQTNYTGAIGFEFGQHVVAYYVSNDVNGVGTLFRHEDINTNHLANGVVVFTATKLDSTGNPTTNFPHAVLLEIGTLEKRTLEHYNSLSNSPLALAYLTNQAGHLHIFRQRISIKAVQP